MLATLSKADCLIIRPVHAPAAKAGESVPVVLLRRMRRARLGQLFRIGILIIGSASLYRMSVVWLGFHPLGGGTYFPALPEMVVTLGFMAMQVLAYLVIVKKFPILDAKRATSRRRAGQGSGGRINGGQVG